jgi:hypothetical protein
MSENRKKEIERHSNGGLAYHCTWLEVKGLNFRTHPNLRSFDDKHWTRIGWHRKYFSNGQLAWQIKYDEFGVSIQDMFKSFREDGTRIIYNSSLS